VIGTLLIERFDSDSSFKSIEACAGKVSVHEMACHFNSLHFWRKAPGEPEQDARRLSAGNRLSISGVLESASRQKICYVRGRKLKGLTRIAWLCSRLTPDKR
jgi:hypothetical protein